MKIGRRESLFIAIAIGLFGISLTAILLAGWNKVTFWILNIGRLIFGYSTGLLSVIVSRTIEETVPTHLYSSLAVCVNMMMSFGQFIAFLWAEVLPDDDDTEALEKTKNWIYPYLICPGGLYLIGLLGLLCIVREDAIKFLIVNGKNDQARKHIRRLYKHAFDDEEADRYIYIIKRTIGGGVSNLTLCDGLFNPRYKIASWTSIVYMLFHELTGINVINIYSNKMFEDM